MSDDKPKAAPREWTDYADNEQDGLTIIMLIEEREALEAKCARYEAALKLIAQMNSPMGFAGCPDVARQALAHEEGEK